MICFPKNGLQLSSTLHTNLKKIEVKYTTSISSIFHLAWHKALNAYGGGIETVVAEYIGEANVTPIVVSHNMPNYLCIDYILQLDKQRKNLKFHKDKLPNAKFDSWISFNSNIESTLDIPFGLNVQSTEVLSVIYITFNNYLVDANKMYKLMDVLHMLLLQISSNPLQTVSKLEFLSSDEVNQLHQWNETDGDYPQEKRLNCLFEEAVQRTPKSIAVIYDLEKITYFELNKKANMLAFHLHTKMLIPVESFVLLFLEKSEKMIVTTLACWKSGIAYVPVDPNYPDARIRFIFEDTMAKYIITNDKFCAKLEQFTHMNKGITVIQIESLIFDLSNDSRIPTYNINRCLSSNQLAYATYTSGTTGTPKCIPKHHNNLVNSITDIAHKYEVVNQHEVIVLFSSYVFEPFARQMLLALLNGHQLIIVDDNDKLDTYKFPLLMKTHGVTYLNGTASVLREYNFDICPSLRKLVLVGEDLTRNRYETLRKKFNGIIINEYGFTESAFSTCIKIFEPDAKRCDRSLGWPLRNVKLYILDNNLKRLPIGATGILWVGGVGVSKGYMNNYKLTAERFLTNPFQTLVDKQYKKNAVIYNTGDLVRWLNDGQIEYIGRKDFQVKLNGIRVELSEIEATLVKYQSVDRCIAITKNVGDSNRLIVYFTASKTLTEHELIKYIESQLPRYMIPQRVIQVDKIPTNVNGKIDIRALPEVDLSQKYINKCDARNTIDKELVYIMSNLFVINVEKISIYDDFFMLGGDSITCIQLICRIRQNLGYELSVENIFMLRTIKSISDYVTNLDVIAYTEKLPKQIIALPTPDKTDDIEAVYMANNLQQGLLYHYLKQSNCDDAYIMQAVYTYATEICPVHLKSAWENAQKTFNTLRIRFVCAEESFQVVDSSQHLRWNYTDISCTSESNTPEKFVRTLQQNDRNKKYCLENGQLIRIYFIKQRKNFFYLLLSYHHAIIDGWSIPLLLDYVHKNYIQLTRGDKIVLEIEETYGAAQRYIHLRRDDNIAYWKKQVKSITSRCDLNNLLNDISRHKINLTNYNHIYDQRELSFIIKNVNDLSIKSVCYKHGITLHSIVQFVWHKVLHVYGNSSQTVVGTVVSGRNIPIYNIESSVGLYINTLPLIVNHNLQEHMSCLEAITEIQNKVNSMNNRSNVALANIQDGELKHKLFDSLLVFENYPILDKADVRARNSILKFEEKYQVEKLDYPLAVICKMHDDGTLLFKICYAGELFEDNTISSILRVVNEIFFNVVSNFEQKVGNINLLDCSQLERLNKWNITTESYPSEKLLHQIFEEEVNRVPEKTAVVYENLKLTYAQLNEHSNKLGHFIRNILNSQHSSNQIVAIFMEKSEKMIISILAVWKAGAAYCPIDPSFPEDRIKYIIEDTNASAIIANSMFSVQLQVLARSLPIIVAEELSDNTAQMPNFNPSIITKSLDLAYVIYTSGTTGRPKGCMVQHQGVVNLQVSLAKLLGLKNTEEVFLSFSNYVFDHFVEQMTNALLNGQTLIVLNDKMRTDRKILYEYMHFNKVTYLSGTPSVLSAYEYTGFQYLRTIDAVGENFSKPVFNKIRSTFTGRIINGYGPTEVSITTHKKLYYNEEKRSNNSIGTAVANITCYVLNKSMKMVPIGAVGELFLGDVGVTKGYLNEQNITSSRFLQNPYQSKKESQLGRNAIIYKTGDLVRFLPNGELEYMGREDFQVKIRGLRIELEEIEYVISQYPGITRSVVIAVNNIPEHDNGIQRTYLVGYFISSNKVIEHQIKLYLMSKLPEYMVPNRLIQMDSIPVTISGKLDLENMPKVDPYQNNKEYIEPRNEIELKLCAIWSDLLCMPMEQISVDDDFFSLGGDSLLTIKLSFKIQSALIKNVSIADVFNNRTIEQLALYIIKNDEGSIAILPRDHQENTVLSYAQERLLFINNFENGSYAYNVPINLIISKNIDRSKLIESFRAIISRHATLRTIFPYVGGYQIQHVLSADEAVHRIYILEHKVASTIELHQELERELLKSFDLSNDIPVRIAFFDNDENNHSYNMCIMVHHVCFDGWSLNILKQELKALYDFYCCEAMTVCLPNIKVRYTDYTIWQRMYLTGKRLKDLSDYWLHNLEGYEPLDLMFDYPRPLHFDYKGQDMQFSVDKKTIDTIKLHAKLLSISMYSLFLGTFCILLSSISNQNDIVIGSPTANRTRQETENMIGLFVNLLVLRVNINWTATLKDLLLAVSNTVSLAHAHQEFPFERLVKLLNVKGDTSRHPIVNVVFNMYRTVDDTQSTMGLLLSDYVMPAEVYSSAKHDLSITASETKTGVTFNFNYATSIFNSDTITSYMESFKHMLFQVAHMENVADFVLSNLIIAPPSQISELYPDIPQQSFPEDGKTLKQIFEYNAAKIPENTAIVFGYKNLSYAVLNQRSNQLAHYLSLISQLQPDSRVALLLDKNELMIISILAVWKSGAAYVPIDPSYPNNRIKLILEVSKPTAIIANSQYRYKFSYFSISYPIIEIDLPSVQAMLKMQSKENKETFENDTNIAYMIFTSGSTGIPKPVTVAHRGIVNFLSDIKRRYFEDDSVQQCIALLSNYVFDFSVEQMLLSIFSCNKLIIPKSLDLDDKFYNFMNEQKLTFLSGTPTFLQQINFMRFKFLHTIVAAGEPFLLGHYQKMRNEFSGTIYVAYGVTETTVYNMVMKYKNSDKFEESLGDTLANTKACVCSSQLQILPYGSVGELYLFGDCLACGYFNQQELSKERFLQNPFQTLQEKIDKRFPRMYKTGDIVRVLQGNIKFIGRNDGQIKVRGYRVETGDICNSVMQFPGVKECAVIQKCYENATYLVCYYVASFTILNDDLQEWLLSNLPAHMVPSIFIHIKDGLPMTVNKKLNTKLLPDVSLANNKSIYALPRTDMEKRLCNIYASILSLGSVGINDNWFSIGGDSISSLQLANSIKAELGYDITARDIFECKTIMNLSNRMIQNTYACINNSAEQGKLTGNVPLLPIQKWFFNKNLKNSNHWNQSFTIKTPHLDINRLEKAVKLLANYHDAFRLRYEKDFKVYRQYYSLENINIPLYIIDISSYTSSELSKHLYILQSSFDISKGPIACAAYLQNSDSNDAMVWFAVHHLIIDAVSWRIICQDLCTLYEGKTLAMKTSSYRQWSSAIQDYVMSTAEKSYWDYTRSRVHNTQIQSVTQQQSNVNIVFDENVTSSILREANQAYDSKTSELLLAAFSYALQELTKRPNNAIALEGHGREEFKGLFCSRTVGWFTSIYPVMLEVKENLASTLQATKKNLRLIPNNGIGYGAIYGYNDRALPPVYFNYLGQIGLNNALNVWNLNDNIGDMNIDRAVENKNADYGIIDVTIAVVHGKMKVDISSWVERKKTECFAHVFNTALKDILKHTLSLATNVGKNIIKTEDFIPFFEFNIGLKGAKTVFILPPGNGGAESYFNNIVKHMTRFKLVVFNNIYLYSNNQHECTFEKLAKYYITHIRSIKVYGGYHLIGWSFGGLLSMEIARQLVREGSFIETLTFIDSYFNIAKCSKDIGYGENENIIERINYLYCPSTEDMKLLTKKTRMIVLFKASKGNDVYSSEPQRILYEYYKHTTYNELDKLVGSHNINVQYMKEDTHWSWVKNENQVKKICSMFTQYT